MAKIKLQSKNIRTVANEKEINVEIINSKVMIDRIYLENRLYEKIFNKKFKEQGSKPWKRGIVKIIYCCNEGKKKNITHRLFASGNNLGITQEVAGLESETIQILGINTEDNTKITICRGSRFFFYWNHPSHHNRIAFKLSVFFGCISFISLLISIVSILFVIK